MLSKSDFINTYVLLGGDRRRASCVSPVIVLTLLLILSYTVASPAMANVCRNYYGQRICIVSINRSAKNYWEYRASVTVDGVKRPQEVYNCRQKLRVQQDGTVVPFKPQDPGELICSFFRNTAYKAQ